jgi:hypothetical protein
MPSVPAPFALLELIQGSMVTQAGRRAHKTGDAPTVDDPTRVSR